MLRSSSLPRVHADYYFYVKGCLGCVGVDAQLLLVASTSVAVLRRVWGVVVDCEGFATTTSGVSRMFEIVGNRIRALYGYSVPVYLRLEEDRRVEWLFHGTTSEAAKEILVKGLKPMKRLWVHLSPTKNIAVQVGKRRTSDPVILVVNCKEAREAGMKFYKASEQVYLCKFVPAKYIRKLLD